MGDPRHDFGLVAEAAVAAWLTDAGWRVLERRANSPTGGEVDLVALDPSRALVAIEVRARHSRRAGEAAVTVNARRVARLGRTLATIAANGRFGHSALRVDLVTVEPAGQPGRWRLFRLPGIG
jgi:Holliday junction resolvase-like predicted endonuclease